MCAGAWSSACTAPGRRARSPCARTSIRWRPRPRSPGRCSRHCATPGPAASSCRRPAHVDGRLRRATGRSASPISWLMPAASWAAVTRLGGGAHDALPPEFLELLESFFRLAMDRGLDMDLHVDESGDLGAKALIEIAHMAVRLGFKGRLQCGHCCSLAMQPDDSWTIPCARSPRPASPSSACRCATCTCRAAPPGARRAGAASPCYTSCSGDGIDVSIASDNCRDPFYAFGDHDMLEVMTQATRIAHLDHPFGDWPHRFTAVPAAVMGLADRGRLKAGAPADLVLLSARFMSEMLSRSQADRIVLRGGSAIDTSLPDYRELDGLLCGRRDPGRRSCLSRAARRAGADRSSRPAPPAQPRLLLVFADPQGELDGKAADLIVVPRTVDEWCASPPPAPASACRWWCAAAPPAITARWCRCRAACCSTWRASTARCGSSAAAAASRPACGWATPTACPAKGWELRMFPSTRRQAHRRRLCLRRRGGRGLDPLRPAARCRLGAGAEGRYLRARRRA